MSTEYEIRVNGEPFTVASGTTVAGLVRLLDLPADRVAVELNRSIVRRRDWDGRLLETGSVVEVVQLVGGG